MRTPGSDKRSFRRGDQIEATVVEIVEKNEFIVRYGGGVDDAGARLLRLKFELKSESWRSWRNGDSVWLRVLEIDPLRFQLVEPLSEQRRRGRIDVSV